MRREVPNLLLMLYELTKKILKISQHAILAAMAIRKPQPLAHIHAPGRRVVNYFSKSQMIYRPPLKSRLKRALYAVEIFWQSANRSFFSIDVVSESICATVLMETNWAPYQVSVSLLSAYYSPCISFSLDELIVEFFWMDKGSVCVDSSPPASRPAARRAYNCTRQLTKRVFEFSDAC